MPIGLFALSGLLEVELLNLPINKSLTISLLGWFEVAGILATVPFWGRGLVSEGLVSEDVAFGYAPMAGVLLGIPSFSLLCRMVKCRRCRHRLFWHAIAKQSHPQGLRWFFSARICPNCGASAG